MTIDYEWDDEKAALNRRKHGVSFAKAIEVLAGRTITKIDDRQDYGEMRKIAMGEDKAGRLHFVAFTERESAVRIISARKANERERRLFERARQQEDKCGKGHKP